MFSLTSLLEVARPSLHLQEKFFFWTIPGDTIRILFDLPGLVKKRLYRPSRWSKVIRKFQFLEDHEKEILHQLLEPQHWVQSPDLEALTIERKALILDVLNDFYLYKGTKKY